MSEIGSSVVAHYGPEYFAWQRQMGEFGGWANITKFSRYVRPDMKVLEFGCGGGYLLAAVDCREKLGIEINPSARNQAAQLGVRTIEAADDAEDGWADLLISHHALEHCEHPLAELRRLLPKVAPGGTVVFVVPCETIRCAYRSGDVNQHLYTWSPMCIANLFSAAGFHVLEAHPYISLWPPMIYRLLRHVGGRALFQFGCKCWGLVAYFSLLPRLNNEVRVVATRSV